MIKFSCSKCDKAYRVSDDYAGKKVRCKECQTVNMIPAAQPAQPEVGCGDSIAAYNNLLQELSKYEQQAPPIEMES